jgi:phage gp36-like protein
MDDMRRVIYEDTIDYLRRVSRGEVVLDVTPEPTAEDVTAITSNKTSASRIFTSTELSTY